VQPSAIACIVENVISILCKTLLKSAAPAVPKQTPRFISYGVVGPIQGETFRIVRVLRIGLREHEVSRRGVHRLQIEVAAKSPPKVGVDDIVCVIRIKVSRSAIGAVFILLRISDEDGASFRAKIVCRAVICQDLRQAHPVIVCHIRVGILFIELVDDELIAGPLRGAPGCSRALSIDPVRGRKFEFRRRDPLGLPVGLMDPGVSQTVGDLFIRLHLLRIRVAFSPVGHREFPGVNIFCLFTFPKRPAAGKLRAHDAIGKKPGKHLHTILLIGQRPQTDFRLFQRVVFIYGVGNRPLDVHIQWKFGGRVSRTGKAHSILIFSYGGKHQSHVGASIHPLPHSRRDIKGFPFISRYILRICDNAVGDRFIVPGIVGPALPAVVHHLAVHLRSRFRASPEFIYPKICTDDSVLRQIQILCQVLKIVVDLDKRASRSIICTVGRTDQRAVFIARIKVGHLPVIHIGTCGKLFRTMTVFHQVPLHIVLRKIDGRSRIDGDRIYPLRRRKPLLIRLDA